MKKMKWTPAMMGLAGAGGLGLLYLLFKPKEAAAAPPPVQPPAPCPGGAARDSTGACPPVQPTMQLCPDGSKIPVTATCPKSSCPSHGHPAFPNTAPVPTIAIVASGEGQLNQPLNVGISKLPLSAAGPAADCIQDPSTDALVFLQAWETTPGGFKPIFIDSGPVGWPEPAVGIVITEGGLTGLQKAKNKDIIISSKDSYVSAYFDPKQTADIFRMEAQGSFVLVWTTDVAGKPLAWWYMTWRAPT